MVGEHIGQQGERVAVRRQVGQRGGSDGGLGATVRSRAGTTIVISNGARSLPRVNEFRVFVANMRAANGIAHCIDGVLAL
jgi:uncharacterized surface protein with fasciclin (FAS1) repeats